MDLILSAVEVRVLGALIEKEVTTPEYYPLSLNALTNACNQKSNRDPVMDLDEKEVAYVVDVLKEKRLAWQLSTAGGRVPKYEHNIRSIFPLSEKESAALCVLMLRGPQTVGEIRVRTERMHSFESLDEVEKTLRELSQREDGPLVAELPRVPGRKENRFTHLFSGQPDLTGIEMETVAENPAQGRVREIVSPGKDRIAALEEEVAKLRDDFEVLRNEFANFRRQLE